MNEDPQEFKQLRKLLKLKRYEQPPPRFFNEFSASVVAGIRAPKTARSGSNLLDYLPWVERFFKKVEGNVMIAGGLATAICAVLIGGVMWSDHVENPRPDEGNLTPGGTFSSVGNQTMLANASSDTSAMFGSTNAVFNRSLAGDNFQSFKQDALFPLPSQ